MPYTLREDQGKAVEWLQDKKRGLVHAPAGSGKTVIAAAACAQASLLGRVRSIGWMCNTIEQKEQAEKAISGTPAHPEASVSIACGITSPDFSSCDLIIVDEGHHVLADTWWQSVNDFKGPIWVFTATPWSGDAERDEKFRSFVEDQIFVIDRKTLEEQGHLAKGKVYIYRLGETGRFDDRLEILVAEETKRRVARYPYLPECRALVSAKNMARAAWDVMLEKHGYTWTCDRVKLPERPAAEDDTTFAMVHLWQESQRVADKILYDEHAKRVRWQYTCDALKEDVLRNNTALTIVRRDVAQGRSVLVLVQSVEHGEKLAAQLHKTAVVHSKLAKAKRREAIKRFREGSLDILIATSLADEGLDVPRASSLVLLAGGRSAAKLEQRAGRVLRPFEGKHFGVIHDFMDEGYRMGFAQAKARVATYRKLGYDPEAVAFV